MTASSATFINNAITNIPKKGLSIVIVQSGVTDHYAQEIALFHFNKTDPHIFNTCRSFSPNNITLLKEEVCGINECENINNQISKFLESLEVQTVPNSVQNQLQELYNFYYFAIRFKL